jgi:flavin-binding protein dodecin
VQDHVYKTIEVTGTSKNGVDDAIRNAVSRASKTVRDMRWFQVTETRGDIRDGEIGHWQVTMKIGFTLAD